MDAYRDEPATKKDLDQVKQELTAKLDRIAPQVVENREQMVPKMRSTNALMRLCAAWTRWWIRRELLLRRGSGG
jgi:tagatose-1,6-bisphosphate aldolase